MRGKDQARINTIGSQISKALTREEFNAFKRKIWISVAGAGLVLLLLSLSWDLFAVFFQRSRMLSFTFQRGLGAWQIVGALIGVVILIAGAQRAIKYGRVK